MHIRIPHSITRGLGREVFRWDVDKEEYVQAETTTRIIEPRISVEVRTTLPTAWLLPLQKAGDIHVAGQADTVLSSVNLTTNSGSITIKEVTARSVFLNVTAGGVAASLVASPDFHIVARAATVYGDMLPYRRVESGLLSLDHVELERWFQRGYGAPENSGPWNPLPLLCMGSTT